MTRRILSSAVSAACLMGMGAGGALAQQGSDAKSTALEQRVAELEAANAERATPLSFTAGGSTQVTLYGFVRAEFFYDFDNDQGDLSQTRRIGEPALATSGAFNTSVRTSRLGVRSTTPSSFGDIGTQLEVDLFGSGGTAEFRLRHANITIGDRWLVGQTWTNFMPIGQYTRTADFNGPVGLTFARLPQIRFTGHPNDQLQYSFSIEENFDSASSDPMLTAAAQYSADTFTLRGALLASETVSGGQTIDQRGATLAASFRPWSGGTFTATGVAGEGIGGLMIGGGANAVGGIGNDVTGYSIELRQDIGSKWNVGVAYGKEDYDQPTNTGTLDFTELESVHVNAFYSMTDNLDIGLEYIHGRRKTTANQTFTADRIGASVTLNF